jgi:hypothetical protein
MTRGGNDSAQEMLEIRKRKEKMERPRRSYEVKVKVKLPLWFNWAPRHEGVLGEWRYSPTHSLTSVLDGGEWSASCPGRFTLWERAFGIHWIGGWVGPRAFLDAGNRTLEPQPVAQRYTDWAITNLDTRQGKGKVVTVLN